MMEKTRLRSADVVTSALLIGFGFWELFETFKMPMKDSFGGVMNVWYVSPALLPMIIGGGIILLGINILVNGLKSGGWETLQEQIRQKRSGGISEAGVRFAAILLPLLSLVYMNLPRIDFFICIALFLSFTITVFYLDDPMLLKKFFRFYFIEMGILFIIFILGMDRMLNAAFPYSVDIIALGLLAGLIVFMFRSIRDKPGYRKKFLHGMIMSFATPFVLVPAFRFLLRVPLPKEGGIVDLMYLVYYALR